MSPASSTAAAGVALGDLLTLRSEIIHPRDNPSGPDLFVGLEHIESGTGRRLGSEQIEKSEMTGRKARFRAGDIVYGYLRPYLNKVWLAEFDGLCSVDQYVYQVDGSRADPTYLAWFMRSPAFLSRAPVDSGPGQLPRIRLNEIADVALDLPSLTEQGRIAVALRQRLDSAARMRAAAGCQLKTAQGAWRREADAHFSGQEAVSIQTAPLGSLILGKGQYGTSTRSNPDGHGLPVLGMPNIGVGTIKWEPLNHVDLPEAELARYRLQPGDLLFNRTNSAEWVGKSAVFRDAREAVFASYVVRFRLDESRVLPEYVCDLVNSTHGRRFIEANMTRAIGQVNISASTISRLEVPLTPMDEQRRLVARLDAVARASGRVRDAAVVTLNDVTSLEAAILRDAFS